MLAASFVWEGKKPSPSQLASSRLPLVAKVTKVPDKYGKSCPELATNAVLWVFGSAREQRVLLKTSDSRTYLSVPLESHIKFVKVFLHDRGPAMLIKNLLGSKQDAELKVEISGNMGNRLSSTPDNKDPVEYGILQVVGTYSEMVLHCQAIISGTGELSPKKLNVSVNSPLTFDIATGLARKGADEFNRLKDKLKQNQSTAKAEDQPETPTDIVLFSNAPKSLQDVNTLEHACCLHQSGSAESSDADVSLRNVMKKLEEKVGSGIKQVPRKSELPGTQKKSRVDTRIPGKDESRNSDYLEPDKPPPINDYVNNPDTNRPTPSQILDDIRKSNQAESKNSFSGKSKSALDAGNAHKTQAKSSEVKSPLGGSGDYDDYLNEVEFPTVPKPDVPVASVVKPEVLVEYEDIPSSVPQPHTVGHEKSLQQAKQPFKDIALKTGDYVNERKADVVELRTNQGGTLDRKRASDEKSSRPQNEKQQQVIVNDFYELADDPNQKQLGQHPRQGVPLPSVPSLHASTPSLAKDRKVKSRFSMLFKKSRSPVQITPTRVSVGVTHNDYVNDRANNRKDAEGIEYVFPENKWKSASEVPKNIKNFTIGDVTLCLELLHMERYIDRFRNRNVDGAFLVKVNKKMLTDTFGMEEFDAKQLFEFAKKKWRPKS